MSESPFSEVALNYSLHIDHIMVARKRFEDEVRRFNDEIYDILRTALHTSLEHDPSFKFTDPEVEGSSRTSTATSFWVSCASKIMAKKPEMKNYRTAGTFITGFFYDSSLRKFCWHATFSNADYLSDQIDEKVFEEVKSAGGAFENPAYERSSQVFFFRIPIDENFPTDTGERIGSALDVLLPHMKNALGESGFNSVGEIDTAA